MDIDESLRSVFRSAPFIARLGIELENLGPGFGEASLALQPWQLQQTKLVHAGVIAALNRTALRRPQAVWWKIRSAVARGSGHAAAMDPRLETGRLLREWRTMQVMVGIYCRGHAHARVADAGLCADCQGFLDYAERRLEKCPYGPEKPTCARCPIHCYKPQPRQLAGDIMRYAGPRMLLRHPWLSFTHFMDKARRVEHPMEARRKQRAPD